MLENTRPLVLYHANCMDGWCCAWCAHLKFGDSADYIPVQYGQEPPDVAGREVYILDFSYKRPVMRSILSQARKVVVLDHHKSAESELAGIVDEFIQRPDLIMNSPGSELPFIRFNMDKSGGRLTWEYFFSGNEPPWLVNFTEDRDLWRWKLPNSRDVNAAMASLPRDFATWNRLYMQGPHNGLPTESLVSDGAAILRYQSQLVDSIAATAREVKIEGHKVLAANTSCLFSEVAEKLAQDRPFGAAWFIRSDGKKQWSLRSREGGVDVSAVAKLRGGGGHTAAAGFEE